jgi:hypothetical protein
MYPIVSPWNPTAIWSPGQSAALPVCGPTARPTKRFAGRGGGWRRGEYPKYEWMILGVSPILGNLNLPWKLGYILGYTGIIKGYNGFRMYYNFIMFYIMLYIRTHIYIFIMGYNWYNGIYWDYNEIYGDYDPLNTIYLPVICHSFLWNITIFNG